MKRIIVQYAGRYRESQPFGELVAAEDELEGDDAEQAPVAGEEDASPAVPGVHGGVGLHDLEIESARSVGEHEIRHYPARDAVRYPERGAYREDAGADLRLLMAYRRARPYVLLHRDDC